MLELERLCAFVLLGVVSAACVPDIEDDTSRVVGPRVLALRADPAESVEGDDVTVTALAVGPDGGRLDVDFTLCLDRNPLTELGPVSPRCLDSRVAAPDIVEALGAGQATALTVPSAACTLFGPERPDPKPGEPSPRAVDPDPTGGFFQPFVAWLGGDATLGAVRLACPLSAAPRDATIDYNRRYRANENPAVLAFERVLGDGSGDPLGRGNAIRVAPGERVRFRAVVPSCPTEPLCGDGICGPREDRTSCGEDCDSPKGCGGAEPYAIYDPGSRAVRETVEVLIASWYATGGRFREERTAATEPDILENDWMAPGEPGLTRLWVVVRDDRGGIDWREGIVEVSR